MSPPDEPQPPSALVSFPQSPQSFSDRERKGNPGDQDNTATAQVFRHSGRQTSTSDQVKLHRHQGLEWNLIRRGWAEYIIGNQRLKLRAGDLVKLSPQQAHVILNCSPRFDMWVIWLRGETKQGSAECTNSNECQSNVESINGDIDSLRHVRTADAKLINELAMVAAAQNGDFSRFNSTIKALLDQIDYAWKQAGEVTISPQPIHTAVQQSVHILDQRSGDISIDQLASEVFLSRSRLSRLFSQQTGITLAGYRNRCRLERFQQLREMHPRQTLLALALQSGFGSYMQFYRIYLDHYGYSPKYSDK